MNVKLIYKVLFVQYFIVSTTETIANKLLEINNYELFYFLNYLSSQLSFQQIIFQMNSILSFNNN